MKNSIVKLMGTYEIGYSYKELVLVDKIEAIAKLDSNNIALVMDAGVNIETGAATYGITIIDNTTEVPIQLKLSELHHKGATDGEMISSKKGILMVYIHLKS